MRRHQLPPGQLTGAIQLVEGNPRLVRRHLEDGIGRCVHDPGPGLPLHFGKFRDDGRPAGHAVADDRPPRIPREGVDHLGRKPLRIGRERAREMQPGDLPVPGGGVLAARPRQHHAEPAHRMRHRCHPRNGRGIPQAKSLQIRKIQPADRTREIPQGITAPVAVRRRIRSLPTTDSIEHDDECALGIGHDSGDPDDEVEGKMLWNIGGTLRRRPTSSS